MTASASEHCHASQPAACIRGPATPKKRGPACALSEGADQRRAEVIARRFAGHETERGTGLVSIGRAQRTMLRVDCGRNSTRAAKLGLLRPPAP